MIQHLTFERHTPLTATLRRFPGAFIPKENWLMTCSLLPDKEGNAEEEFQRTDQFNWGEIQEVGQHKLDGREVHSEAREYRKQEEDGWHRQYRW